MNQRELAKRNANRRSRPDTYCCDDARLYLEPFFYEGVWLWRFRLRYWSVQYKPPALGFCPWCGKRLPDRGRLKIEEVRHEGEG